MTDIPKNDTVFDSESQHVGHVYARALLGAATAAGTPDAVLAELESLVEDVLDKNPKLEAALSSPRIKQDEKDGVLDRIFQGKMDPTLFRFLKILSRRGRLAFIRSIRQEAVQQRDEELNKLRVIVIAAQPLSDQQIQDVSNKLSQSLGRQVGVSVKIDPRLIGGLQIRVGDTVYDGSVQGRLDQLSRTVRSSAERAMKEKLDSLIGA